ncbi:hypothetical protein D3C84_665070 [compost metagenome]
MAWVAASISPAIRNRLSKLFGVVMTNWMGRPLEAPGSSGNWKVVMAIPGMSFTRPATRSSTSFWLASRWLQGTMEAMPKAWLALNTPEKTWE